MNPTTQSTTTQSTTSQSTTSRSKTSLYRIIPVDPAVVKSHPPMYGAFTIHLPHRLQIIPVPTGSNSSRIQNTTSSCKANSSASISSSASSTRTSVSSQISSHCEQCAHKTEPSNCEQFIDDNTPSHVRDVLLQAVAIQPYDEFDKRDPHEFVEQFELYAELLKLNRKQKQVLFARMAFRDDTAYRQMLRSHPTYEGIKHAFLMYTWTRQLSASQ